MKPEGIFKVLGVVFVSASAVLVTSAWSTYRPILSFIGQAEAVQGTVVEFTESSDDTAGGSVPSATTYRLVVIFRTRSGQFTEFTDSVRHSAPPYRIGQVVEILYSREDPSDARLQNFTSLYFLPVMLAGIGSISGLLGGGLLIASIFTSRRSAYFQDRDLLKARITKLRRDSHALRKELDKAPVYRYGSFVPGREEWEKRWDASPGRRILLYAFRDYSGSFMKWATALNRHTDYAVRLVTYGVHQFNYELDLVLPMPHILDRSDIESLAQEADLIHIKDETGFFDGTNKLPSDLLTKHGKPMVFTHYGGYARKHAEDHDYIRYVQRFDARISMTPDLIFEWFDGSYIPHAIDTENYSYAWTNGDRLAHSPSITGRKATSELHDAVSDLDIEFDLIQGVSFRECLSRKRRCNLFFDQAGKERVEKLGVSTIIGWYGNSAIEAAVHGIPSIAHLSRHAFNGALRAGKDIESHCPIINTELGASGIRKTLRRWLDMPPDDRRSLSRRTRAWTESFHSYPVVANELASVYATVLGHSIDRNHTRPTLTHRPSS